MSDPRRMNRLALCALAGLAFALPLVAAAAAGAEADPAAPPAIAARYRITDLGVLPGHRASIAVGLNNAGQVLGESTGPKAGHPRIQETRVFVWSEADGMTDIGMPPGESMLTAGGINDAGMVVGYSSYGPNAFSWQAGSGLQEVVPWPGAWQTRLYAIDSAGRAVGQSSGPGVAQRAVSWTSARGIRPLPPHRRFSIALGLNDRGQTIGVQLYADKQISVLRQPDGTVVRLGHLPVDRGARATTNPFAINDAGQVVGVSSIGDGFHSHAMLWTPEAGMQDLGALPGDRNSLATGINRQGIVVGMSGPTLYMSHMFVWAPSTGMRDANDLVDPDDPLRGIVHLDAAYAINDRGQIAGDARVAGSLHAVLLTPVR